MKRDHTLPESSSVLIDIIRFSAALVVYYWHITQPIMGAGFRQWGEAGEYAVPVFFVLSGFVIRFVTLSREHTIVEYAIDRASRIYSVVLPAIALALVCWLLCISIDRTLYLSLWGQINNHLLVRLVSNVLFLSQVWGHNTVLPMDSPFWSLGYEVPYYIIYALIFYLRSSIKIFLVTIWLLIFGPALLFLLPIWWLGCWIYDLYFQIRKTYLATTLRIATLSWLIAGIGLFTLGHKDLLSFPILLIKYGERIPNPLNLFHLTAGRSTMKAFSTGVVSGMFMLLGVLLSDWIHIPRGHHLVTKFRRIADGTFCIYLMHYPLFTLGRVSGWFSKDARGRTIAILIALCVALIICAGPTDSLKKKIRALLKKAHQRYLSKSGPEYVAITK